MDSEFNNVQTPLESSDPKIKKTQEFLEKYRDIQGEVDVTAVANKAVEATSMNKSLKKIIAFGTLGIIVVIGMMVASVV